MAKINGTTLLVYDNGTLIAAQKGLTINVSQNLFDTTTKDSSGWAEHNNGLRQSDISFDALASTEGLSTAELLAHISGRTSLLLVIDGLGLPLVCQADCVSVALSGGTEEAASLSGSFKVNGNLYYLSGANAALVTDPDAGGTDYDTMTVSGIKISSAINAAGNAYVSSNAFGVTAADVIKVALYLTVTSGQVPTVAIYDNTSANISNAVALVAGMNFITLTVTTTDASALLRFTNSGAANWSTSNIYCFKS